MRAGSKAACLFRSALREFTLRPASRDRRAEHAEKKSVTARFRSEHGNPREFNGAEMMIRVYHESKERHVIRFSLSRIGQGPDFLLESEK